MSGNLRRALALLFDRFGEESVPETELAKMASLTLGWCKPSQAPSLLHRGLQANLLRRDADLYQLAFDPEDVDVPFGFEPDASFFEPLDDPPAPEPSGPPPEPSAPSEPSVDEGAGQEVVQAGGQEAMDEEEPAPVQETPAQTAPASNTSVLEQLLDGLAQAMGASRQEAVAAVNTKHEGLEGIVTLEGAALIVAAEHGLDVGDAAEQVLAGLTGSTE